MLMEAYCVKCKTKREMQDPRPEFTSAGAPGTRGVCPVCGTTLFRMGRTPAHDGLEPPPSVKRASAPAVRKGNLVIVESPAKARTIGRYLGKDYRVEASVGHVRDLLRSQLSVDVDNDFAPKYRVPNEKRPVIKELKKLANQAENIFLATDLDREGEAIAWHLMEAAEIDPERARRVVFHEITKPAILEAFSHPREIDMNLVNAQQARRVLDRLVGYSLSPILWRKVRNRLSAGRVQSVALRLVVERERQIDEFIPVEYWTIEAELRQQGSSGSFRARLVKVDGQDPNLPDEAAVQPIVTDLQAAVYTIASIKRGTRQRRPQPPFTTSTLQQEASRKLGFTAKRTMAIAQQLYEGIDLGNGDSETVGLITYMRTDSTNVSEMAQQEAREYVTKIHGAEFLPDVPPIYRTRAKGAQEAHEAIRPTSVMRTPKDIKDSLARDQLKLYTLIWKRFVASQMNPAIYDTLAVEIDAAGPHHKHLLRASGSTLRFPGYLAVYEETKGEFEVDEMDEDTKIPNDLEEGKRQDLLNLFPEQHFTQPPPRYSEASLVKALEENGIGRPSTYAPTLSTLQARGYVFREGRRLIPTDTGMTVTDLLIDHFPDIVDIGFTAKMEDDLDRVAEGSGSWVGAVREFYGPFAAQVEKADRDMPEVKAEPEYIGRTCPTCNKGQLMIRWGRFGKFISCDNFPECRHTEPFLEKIGVTCPTCHQGDIVERRSRKNRIFYGCSRYPECDFTSWKKPIATPCPTCQGTLVIANKNFAQCLNCETQHRLDEVLPESQETEAEA
ncbi:MAG: type I DNA topoisomerase [Anaerolineae bacterium]|nr:MAG: type I DNA topoisomerase [Anaerolineae bacterium]